MNGFLNTLVDIFREPSVIIGLIALLGLVLQRKSASDTLKGTIKAFVGFLVLLSRTLVLWGRGFSPSFNLFVLEPWTPLGRVFEFAKDVAAMGVLAGVSVFFYFRIVNPLKRMTMSAEAVLILGIISTMMLADMTYDGAAMALHARQQYLCLGAVKVAT